MTIKSLKDFETYVNNIYLVCKNKDKTLMKSYFTDEFIHPYDDFSPIDVEDIYFIFFKKNIKDSKFPTFILNFCGFDYSIEVQTSFLDVRLNVDYMGLEIKNEVIDKYFAGISKEIPGDYDVTTVSLEEFVNLMKTKNKVK